MKKVSIRWLKMLEDAIQLITYALGIIKPHTHTYIAINSCDSHFIPLTLHVRQFPVLYAGPLLFHLQRWCKNSPWIAINPVHSALVKWRVVERMANG